jgi:hypothetical protein
MVKRCKDGMIGAFGAHGIVGKNIVLVLKFERKTTPGYSRNRWHINVKIHIDFKAVVKSKAIGLVRLEQELGTGSYNQGTVRSGADPRGRAV